MDHAEGLSVDCLSILDEDCDSYGLVEKIKRAHAAHPQDDLYRYIKDSLEELNDIALAKWISEYAFDPALADIDIHSIIATMQLHPDLIRLLLEKAPHVKALCWDHYHPFWWLEEMQKGQMCADDMEVLLDIHEIAVASLECYLISQGRGWK